MRRPGIHGQPLWVSKQGMTKSMWSQLMNIKPIRNDEDLRSAFKQLDLVFQAQEGTPEADEMEVLVTLIEAYEHKHYPMGSTKDGTFPMRAL